MAPPMHSSAQPEREARRDPDLREQQQRQPAEQPEEGDESGEGDPLGGRDVGAPAAKSARGLA